MPSNNFRDCVLTAVNLGGNTNTTTCVAGAIAGTMHAFEDIPKDWIDTLRGTELIEECLFL